MRTARLLFAALGIFLAPTSALGEVNNATPLRLASDVWPPFTDVEGKPRRAAELINAALGRSDISSRTTVTSWDRVVAGLRDSVFDGCAAIWRTDERETFLLYSEPYLENRLVLVGRSGTTVDKLRISDLKGKRLALVKGYAYGEILNDAKGVTVSYGDSDADNLEAVLAGKADYMLADELLVHKLFESYPEKSRKLLAVGSTPLVKRPLHFAVRKSLPNAAEIIKNFNKNIKVLIADGTYNRLLEIAWIRTDVSGDGVEDFVSTGNLSPNAPDAKTGYRLFLSDSQSAAPKGKPKYVVDGKHYQSWDEAAQRIESAARKRPEKAPPAEEAGLVLLRF